MNTKQFYNSWFKQTQFASHWQLVIAKAQSRQGLTLEPDDGWAIWG